MSDPAPVPAPSQVPATSTVHSGSAPGATHPATPGISQHSNAQRKGAPRKGAQHKGAHPASAKPKPAAPPTPPVAANKKVNSPCQSCPLTASRQCELKKLAVKATYKPTDPSQTPVVTKLQTTKVRRKDVIPRSVANKVGNSVVALLAQYDLVIEEIAGFPQKANDEADEKQEHGAPRPAGSLGAETKAPSATVSIEAETELEGTCPVHDHPRFLLKVAHATPNHVEMKPAPLHGAEHMELEDVVWAAGKTQVEIAEILAPTFNSDLAGGDNPFSALFRLIMWIWNANKSMDLEVRAESCGAHSATELGIHDLNALVRVYRDITAAIGIKVPPVKKVTTRVDGRINLDGKSLAVRSQETNYNTNTQTTLSAEAYQKQNVSGFKGTAVFKDAPAEQFALYFKFNELEFLVKETREKATEQAEALNEARKNAYEKYRHWSDERAKKAAIDRAIKDAFSSFLTFRDKIELFFDGFVHKVRAIVNAITSVLDLMKKAPQLGFKLTSEIGFLSGDIFLGWAHSPADSAEKATWALADRYAPLLHKLHAESKITLITFKVEASFGLLIDGGAIGKAEALVAGNISLQVDWAFAIDAILGSGKANGAGVDQASQTITGKSVGGLRATIEVKITFWTYKKEIGIDTGLQVEGKVEWQFMKGEIKYQLNVWSLETGWYFYSTDLKTGEAHVSRHTIIPAKRLLGPIQSVEKI